MVLAPIEADMRVYLNLLKQDWHTHISLDLHDYVHYHKMDLPALSENGHPSIIVELTSEHYRRILSFAVVGADMRVFAHISLGYFHTRVSMTYIQGFLWHIYKRVYTTYKLMFLHFRTDQGWHARVYLLLSALRISADLHDHGPYAQ
jgi:hypothetical protein